MDRDEMLSEMGGIVVSESPLEIIHEDNGDGATGLAAEYAIDGIIQDYMLEHGDG